MDARTTADIDDAFDDSGDRIDDKLSKNGIAATSFYMFMTVLGGHVLVVALGFAVISQGLWKLISHNPSLDVYSAPYLIVLLMAATTAIVYALGVFVAGWRRWSQRLDVVDRSVRAPEEISNSSSRTQILVSPGQSITIDVRALQAGEQNASVPVVDPTARLTVLSVRQIKTRAVALPLVVLLAFPMIFSLMLTNGWMTAQHASTAEIWRVMSRYAQIFMWGGALALTLLVLMALPQWNAETRRLKVVFAALGLMLVLILMAAHGVPPIQTLLAPPANSAVPADLDLFVWLLAIILGLAYASGAIAASAPPSSFVTGTGWRYGGGIAIGVTIPLMICFVLIMPRGKFDLGVSLAQVVWPVVLLIALIAFRSTISNFIPRVRTIKAFGTEWEISDDKIDQQKDLRLPITSFNELMKIVSDLIRRTGRHDTVRILAYTPALGYLARTQEESNALLEALNLRGGRVKIACLQEQELWTWHTMFKNKRTARGVIDCELIKNANLAAERVLRDLEHAGSADPEQKNVFRKSFCELPDYYAFANRDRAVIVVPFSLPQLPMRTQEHLQGLFSGGGFSPEQLRDAEPALIERLLRCETTVKARSLDAMLGGSPVEMFGIVTNNPQIVDYVHKILDAYVR